MINAVSEITGCPKSRMAVVGDRLNTDILSGINADVTTICVLTGETTAKMLETSEIKPDYVFVSVKELLQELLTEYTKN